jgi:diacylglycerol kinase family enzyme
VLFVNPRSGGGGASRARVADRARERGIEVIELGPDRNVTALIDEVVAAGADALGMTGGDGSLAIVAASARERRLPFICVPAGTRNHFARDLGLDPTDPAGALDAFTDAIERHIDVAEVNGRPFLNCVSLGIYGEAVRRSAYRDAKLRTLVEMARAVVGPSAEVPELVFTDNLGREHTHPAIVIVSNNPYAPGRPMERGARPILDSGRLGIIVLDPPAERRHPPGRAWCATSSRLAPPRPYTLASTARRSSWLRRWSS